MNKIKELNEKKNVLIEKMEGLLNKAKKENRNLDTTENTEIKKMKTEAEDISLEIRELETKHNKTMEKTNNMELSKVMDSAIMPGQKLETRSSGKILDFGKLVRVMSGHAEGNDQEERAYYRDMASSGNSVVIPVELSNKIIDIARSQSAVFGQIPLVPMEANNLTIASVKNDAVAGFVVEGELITKSDVIFEPIELKGKTLALFVPVSEQLLDSASNLANILLNTCASAITNTLDSKLIYGDGITEIKGISLYTTIEKPTHTKADYDALIKGVKAVKGNNITPTTIVCNTDYATDLAMLKDLQGQYIAPPKMLDNYILKESNNIHDNEILSYDMNSLLLGMHKNITIEWGTSSDMFQRIQKGLRIYLRTDLGIVQPKGISLTTVTVTP